MRNQPPVKLGKHRGTPIDEHCRLPEIKERRWIGSRGARPRLPDFLVGYRVRFIVQVTRRPSEVEAVPDTIGPSCVSVGQT